MINAVVGLAFFGLFLLLYWIGIGEYLRVRRSADQVYKVASRHIPVRHGELRRSFTLEAGERVIPIGPGGRVAPVRQPRCSHWPRDEVKLPDGVTVAYICRRCDHDWANEDWVRS